MFLAQIQSSIAFLESNPATVAMLMAVTAYTKLFLSGFKWYQPWMATLFAFILAYLFAIPSLPFVPSFDFVLNGFLLGLAATGIYKTGAALAEKAQH